MCEEVIKELFGIPGVLGIINKWVLIIRTYIDNTKMARMNDMSLDIMNKFPIREYGRKNQEHMST